MPQDITNTPKSSPTQNEKHTINEGAGTALFHKGTLIGIWRSSEAARKSRSEPHSNSYGREDPQTGAARDRQKFEKK